jgi:hypothetical protein
MVELLAGNAHVSFEGNLGGLTLSGTSETETEALKRNTLWPEQDFIIVPLEESTIRPTMTAIGGNVPKTIIHIQIEKAGRLEFGAYDNFQPGCVSFGDAVPPMVLDSLVSDGVLEVARTKSDPEVQNQYIRSVAPQSIHPIAADS